MRRCAVWWMGLAAVYVGWALMRWVAVPGLEFDEAEQMLHRQQLRLGYGPQPPLFEWLLWAVHTVTGGSALLVLALLKAALFVVLAVGVAHAVQQATRIETSGAAAGWWVLTLAPLLWDAPRTLTHSLLATACVAVLCAMSMPLILAPDRAISRLRWWLIGSVAGAALLAKYNVALVLGAWCVVVLAAWWLDARSWTRWLARLILHLRALPWALIGLLPLALHMIWMWDRRAEVIEPIRAKMEDAAAGRGAPLEFAQEWLATLGTALFVAAVALAWTARRQRGTTSADIVVNRPPAARPMFWLWLWLVYMAATGAAVAIVGGVAALHTIRLRWIMPLAVPAVVLGGVVLLLGRPDVAKVLRRLSAGVVITAVVLLLLRPTLLALHSRSSWSQLPSAAVARWLEAAGLQRESVVIAAPMQLAGALALHRIATTVVYPGSSRLAIDAERPLCAFWWVGTQPITPRTPRDGDVLAGYQVSVPVTFRWHTHTDGRAPGTLYTQTLRIGPGATCPALAQVYDRLP